MMTLCHLEAKEAFPMKGWIVGHVNECKRNMVQFQGIILKGRWKGFHAAQLKEEVGRKERGLGFLEHFRNFPRRDALGNSTSVFCAQKKNAEENYHFFLHSHAYLFVSQMASEAGNH